MSYILYPLAIWATGIIAIVLQQNDRYKRHSADYWLDGAQWPWLLFLELVGLVVWVSQNWDVIWRKASSPVRWVIRKVRRK